MRCRACCAADVAGLRHLGLLVLMHFGCEIRMAAGFARVLVRDYVLYRTRLSS